MGQSKRREVSARQFVDDMDYLIILRAQGLAMDEEQAEAMKRRMVDYRMAACIQDTREQAEAVKRRMVDYLLAESPAKGIYVKGKND